MKRLGNTICYRGATYVRVWKEDPEGYTPDDDYLISITPEHALVTDKVARSRGAVETGDAYDPTGKWHPGWADLDGRKYAEVDLGYYAPRFIRMDNLPDWRWEWMPGTSQETVPETI